MGITSEEFGHVQQRALSGSENAFEVLRQLANSKMLRAIRGRLPSVLRNKVDSQDLVQDTWLRFWEKHREKYFQNANAFGSFLAKVAETIVIDNVRQKMTSAKYNIKLEKPIDSVKENDRKREIADWQLTPSQELIRREEWAQYISELPPVLRRILILYRKGKVAAEIANELKISKRTVNRYIERVFSEDQFNFGKYK